MLNIIKLYFRRKRLEKNLSQWLHQCFPDVILDTDILFQLNRSLQLKIVQLKDEKEIPENWFAYTFLINRFEYGVEIKCQ